VPGCKLKLLPVGVGELVGEAVWIGVAVGATVGVEVGVGEGVAGTGVGVGVGFRVGVGVGVGVGVDVGVGAGVVEGVGCAVTEKEAEAVLEALSLTAMTWLPTVVELGMVRDMESEPIGEVCTCPMEAGSPSSVSDIMEEPANPVPDTVVEEPAYPFDGDSVRVGLIVKLVVAVLPFASVAETVWMPATDGGTVKESAKEPFVEEVMDPGEVNKADPSNVEDTVEESA
jgi:hypothetical protein